MIDELPVPSAHSAKNIALTQDLARNTIFNLLGWIWPIGLSILSVPYILAKLGNDAYGIFAIVSIVAGYLGLLNGPVAMGNVRFMAEAYAHQEWSELRGVALAGIVINGILSLLGGLAMFLAADGLARVVFSIPAPQVGSAVTAFRLAAFSFILNGLDGAMQSVPMAMRRYDIFNQARLVAGTMNTIAIVLALWWGWGLLGAVLAQVFSSAFGLVLFGVIAWFLLRKCPGSGHRPLNAAFIRRLTSFSSLLFAGQVTSQIGLQIDRSLVAVLLGTSAMTFYTVPTKITDRIPSMMYVFCTALYPLSSEAVATGKITELRQLYHKMVRILFWLSAFIATPLIVLSKDLLGLWIGQDFMINSWLVLSLLAAGVVWRSPGAVAYQVSNGMGRADINLIAAIGTAIFLTVPVVILAMIWGAAGAASGVFFGLLIANLVYDLFVQRKLLSVTSWSESLSPYLRVTIAQVGTILCYYLLPIQINGWIGLLTKACLVSCLYLAWSLFSGALAVEDVRLIAGKVIRMFSLVRVKSLP